VGLNVNKHVPATLRTILREHVDRTGRTGDDFAFGVTARAPFSPSYVRKVAIEAWTQAGLEPVTLHELRHAHRSFLDAAGVSDARADRYLGHSNGSMGRRYTHALRGQLAEDAARLDAYLTRGAAEVVPFPTGANRGAHVPETATASGKVEAS
jgi:integrase